MQNCREPGCGDRGPGAGNGAPALESPRGGAPARTERTEPRPGSLGLSPVPGGQGEQKPCRRKIQGRLPRAAQQAPVVWMISRMLGGPSLGGLDLGAMISSMGRGRK